MSGLRARGAFVVDMAWRGGKLASATVKSLAGHPLRIRYGETVCEFETSAGQTLRFNGALELEPEQN